MEHIEIDIEPALYEEEKLQETVSSTSAEEGENDVTMLFLKLFGPSKEVTMTAREVIKKLREAGWALHEGGSHTIAVSPDGKRKTQIHRHTGDIPPGTLKAIERQSGIKMQ